MAAARSRSSSAARKASAKPTGSGSMSLAKLLTPDICPLYAKPNSSTFDHCRASYVRGLGAFWRVGPGYNSQSVCLEEVRTSLAAAGLYNDRQVPGLEHPGWGAAVSDLPPYRAHSADICRLVRHACQSARALHVQRVSGDHPGDDRPRDWQVAFCFADEGVGADDAARDVYERRCPLEGGHLGDQVLVHQVHGQGTARGGPRDGGHADVLWGQYRDRHGAHRARFAQEDQGLGEGGRDE